MSGVRVEVRLSPIDLIKREGNGLIKDVDSSDYRFLVKELSARHFHLQPEAVFFFFLSNMFKHSR